MSDRLKPGHCHKCGLPLSDNPHPEAGKPSHYLEVGCPKECIPCLTLSRHQWAGCAMKAENEVKDLLAARCNDTAPVAPIGDAPTPSTPAPVAISDSQIEAITYDEYAKRKGDESDFDCILKVVKRCVQEHFEPRSVEGLTRREFESRLRVCYQHDNVRAHVNPSEGFKLTDEQEREIAERVDLNYPIAPPCSGCDSWNSGAAEVNFIQGCPDCAQHMRVANGLEAAPPTRPGGDALSPEERGLFGRTVDQIKEFNETDTDYSVLMGWVLRGFLECTRLQITPKGYAMLATTPTPQDQVLADTDK